MIASQDSAIGNQVKKHIVTRQNTYTIKHKKKGFFKRLAEVFVPGKPDSTEVHRVVEEIINDSIDQAYIPDDSVTQIINTIQHNVHEGQLKKQRDLSRYANKMRMAGNALSQRVNQLLDSIEQDETQRNMNKLSAEYVIRKQAARTIAIIAVLAIVLMLMFCFIVLKDISRSNHYRKELDIPLEINMLGISAGKHYPTERFWCIPHDIGNKVILGLDAHTVDNICDVESYEKALDIVRKYDLNLIDRIEI